MSSLIGLAIKVYPIIPVVWHNHQSHQFCFRKILMYLGNYTGVEYCFCTAFMFVSAALAMALLRSAIYVMLYHLVKKVLVHKTIHN